MDSEAVECASKELSETMCDLFGVIRLVYKRKVCREAALAASLHTFLSDHLKTWICKDMDNSCLSIEKP